LRCTTIDTPLGPLLATADDRHRLTGLWFDMEPPLGSADAELPDLRAQLDAYFKDDLHAFDLPLAPPGTAWQCRVWAALSAIPYGETTTYAALAASLGHPRSARAVGAANGRNPISIVIPCHRLIGTNGALTGYAGGLPRKEWLLRHEASRSAAAGR
jgi:methylated-DNA-[protein]-cysteine S-methyltransferase